MEKQIITFSANEQCLQKTGGVDCYASNTVAYIEAHFDLGTNWSGYDSVRAVWFTDFVGGISTVLDSDGACIVPYEVLTRKSAVKVNLVGSIAENDVLTDRLTTCPVVALTIKCNAKITGTETAELTPSQFEQFVAQVISEVEKVTGMTAEAETLPSGSQATARYGNGVLTIGIPQGAQGEQGESGVGIASVTLNADYTLTITMTDGTSITTTSIRGEKGEKGDTGADGITPSISIGNVETLEPNEDAYVTRRGTDAEPIFDFGIPKGDKGEDAVIPWDSILPTDTASGSIVTITDGQSVVPAKSLKVALEPIQDLHGYDKPWSGGNGKNKVDIADGSVTTTTALLSKELTAGTYTFSVYGKRNDGGLWRVVVAYQNDTPIALGSGASGTTLTRNQATFTLTETTTVRLKLQFLSSYDTLQYERVQLESGSTATDYEPYSNICPISGHTECVTERTGSNIFGGEAFANGIKNAIPQAVLDTDAKTISYASGYATTGRNFTSGIPFKANTQYTIILKFSNTKARTNMRVVYTDGTSQYIPTSTTGLQTIAFTSAVNKTIDYIGGLNSDGASVLYYDECGVFEGVLTADQFESYNGETYTTDLGQTVYGGTLDVVSGVLTVDRAMVDLGTLTWAYEQDRDLFETLLAPRAKSLFDAVCSNYPFVGSYSALVDKSCGYIYGYHIAIKDSTYGTDESAFKTAMNGVQLCYELASPQTYQLTPQEVQLLLGTNTVWSDGDVTIVYNADIQRYIEKKLNA